MTIPLGLCQCGCGQTTTISKVNIPKWGHVKGQPVRFRQGHGRKGYVQPPETRTKIGAAQVGKPAPSRARFGADHHAWKGDEASYRSLHYWVQKHKTRTGMCSDCGEAKKTQWANVDHTYRRVLEDYIELCAKCHRLYDRKLRAA